MKPITIPRKLLLIAVLLLSCLRLSADYVYVPVHSDFRVDGINYKKQSNGTVAVTYRTQNYNSYSGSVTIPEKVTYTSDNGSQTSYRVTSIEASAFRDCPNLMSVRIPYSVLSIGSNAFYGSSCSVSIDMNEAFSIGTNVFNGYTGRIFVTIADGVTELSSGAFSGWSNLYAIYLPNSVSNIGDKAFFGCVALTAIDLPEGITTIGNNTFDGCSSLASITMPNSVTSIGDNAFKGCSSLDAIAIPENVSSIGANAFYGCAALTSVHIPEKVTTIGNNAFAGCSSLKSITVPNGVTSIGDNAFKGCSSLDAIAIPENVSSIGTNAFYGCTALTSVHIPEGVTSISNNTFAGCSSLKSITVPNSVTSIGSEAFANCSSLAAITLSENLSSIGTNAFYGCSSLTSIVIPNNVISINDNAFKECNMLGSISIPGSVLSIGNNAFGGCSALKVVAFEKSDSDGQIKEPQTFQDWTSTNHDHSTSSSQEYQISVIPGDILSFEYWSDSESGFDKLSVIVDDTLISAISGKTVESYCHTFKDSKTVRIVVTYEKDGSSSTGADEGGIRNIVVMGSTGGISLGSNGSLGLFTDCPIECTTIARKLKYDISPFYRNGTLQKACISEINIVKDNLFKDCRNLSDVKLSSDVAEIQVSAFDGCANLSNISLPVSLKGIGNSAFKGCALLPAVAIPASVTSVGASAFSGCSALARLDIEAADSVLTVGNTAFAGCPLDTVALGRPLAYTSSPFKDHQSIRKADIAAVGTVPANLFAGASNLAELSISPEVAEIGASAFSGCSSLPTLALPGKLRSVGDDAFKGCALLPAVAIPASVTSVGASAFSGCSVLARLDIEAADSALTVGNTAFAGCPLDTVALGRPLAYTSSPFKDNQSIRKADIAAGTVPANLFAGAVNLAELSISLEVAEIGASAFSGCSSLPTLTLPGKLRSVGDNAFKGCALLPALAIPASVTSVGASAFSGCSALARLDIEAADSVLTVGNTAFAGCPLDTVALNRALVYTNSPFYGNSSIRKATITAIDSIPANLFNGCSKLNDLAIPSETSVIGPSAFASCSSLRSISFPTALKTIGDNAFRNCASITELSIPASTLNIGRSAFDGCQAMASLTIAEADTLLTLGSAVFSQCPLERVTLGRDLGYQSSPFANMAKLADVTISDKVTAIGASLFSGCASIESIELPAAIRAIGPGAFKGCTGIAEMTIPSEVASLGEEAFGGCANLARLNIATAAKLTDVAKGFDASQLASTHVCGISPAVTLDIAASPVWNDFRKVVFKQDGTVYYPLLWDYPLSVPSALFANEKGCLVAGDREAAVRAIENETPTVNFRGENISEAVKGENGYNVVPDDYRELNRFTVIKADGGLSRTINLTKPGDLFNKIGLQTIQQIETLIVSGDINGTDVMTINRMTMLKNLDLSNANVVEGGQTYRDDLKTSDNLVGSYFFYNVANLENLWLPNSASAIAENAFKDNSSLKNVVIGTNTRSIGMGAFSGCSSLTAIVIPMATTEIGNGVFKGCSALRSVKFEDSGTYPVNVGYNTSSSGLFSDSPVERLYVGRDITYSGKSPFDNVATIRTAEFGEDVTTVGSNYFSGCSSITELVFPGSLKVVGNNAFSGCPALKKVTFEDNPDDEYTDDSTGVYYYPDWTSTNHSDGTSSSYTYNIPVRAGDVISFDYWTDSESNYDKLTVTVNNTTIGSISGKVTNHYSNKFTSAQTVTIKATYSKDNSQSSGADEGGIRNMAVNGVRYVVGLSLGSNGSKGLFSSTSLEEVYVGRALDYTVSPFAGSASLKSANVTRGHIYPSEFQNCAALESIQLGDDVNFIGTRAFQGCENLRGIDVPVGIRSIEQMTFADCSALASVNLPQVLRYIKDSAFANCVKLTDISIPTNVESVGSLAFSNCKALQGISLPQSVSYIGTNAFKDCLSLMTANVPDQVFELLSGTFAECASLNNIRLGCKLTRIADDAFSNCSAISEIRSLNPIPPVITTTVFKSVDKTTCQLVVTKGNLVNYWLDPVWKEFLNMTDNMLSLNPLPAMKYGDAPIDLSDYAPEGAELVYESSNPSVASINGSILTIESAGEATIGAVNPEEGSAMEIIGQMRQLVIDKADLEVALAQETYTITQGDPMPDFTLNYSGLCYQDSADDLDEQPRIVCGAADSSAAGTYEINIEGGSDRNYNLSRKSSRLVINKLEVVLTPLPTVKYGDAPIDLSEYATPGATLRYESSDLDVARIEDGKLIITGAGNATITAYIVIGNDSVTNESLEREFTVEKANLVVSVNPKEVTVGQGDPMPEFTLNYEGFCYDDTFMDLDNQPTIQCAAADTSVPGTYRVSVVGGSDRNYFFSIWTGTLIVKDRSGVENVNGEGGVKCYGRNGVLTVEGAPAGAEIAVYLFDGTLCHAAKADGGVMRFAVAREGFYIVTVNGQPYRLKI